MPGFRLPQSGTRIDRTRPLRFRFDGSTIEGFAGDTVASALLASGRVLVARSFKYHRPRGIYSAGSEEPNALVTLGAGGATEPNTKATVIEAREGLNVRSQNAFPSLGFDFGAVNGAFAPFIAAGFYYKTFMGPGRRGWRFYEGSIRRAAGLGRASFDPDPDRYETRHAFCDMLVVGGGPAGLSAALAAGASGAKVILCDEGPALGGLLDLDDVAAGGEPADWMFSTLSALNGLASVRLMTRTTVYGYYDDNVIGAVEHAERADPTGCQRHWRIAARRVVLATGAVERPFVFPGNDLPGVMLARATLAYASRHGVAVGEDVVVFTNNDSGWQTAVGLSRLRVAVRAVIDPRPEPPAAALAELRNTGARCLPGHVVTAAHGKLSLRSVTIARYDPASGKAETVRDLQCDVLALAAGWTPLVHLASQAGGPPAYSDAIHAFVPGEPRGDWTAVGAVRGTFDPDAVIREGSLAGTEAAKALGFRGLSADLALPRAQGRRKAAAPASTHFPLFEIVSKGKAFVDLQNDVTADDIRLARREGFQSVEHLKRYTTLGMAHDQGKTSNLNGLTILAEARGLPIPAVGTTRFRPPYNPVTLGALAGRAHGAHIAPLRRTPLHDWHVAAGAEMMNVGLWQRPRVYAKAGETLEQAYVREARAVRASVGITDVSTLGKIDVQGPDAATFLDRVYTNVFSTLPVGKVRYGLMLRDDGFLYDDGTTWRLSESRYLMTTTTANGALVYQNLEMLLAIAWPELKVSLASVTDQFAGAAVAGPNSRALLAKAAADLDCSDSGLPFMGVRSGRIGDVPVLIARLSFSGERAYEVYCGSDHAASVWEALLKAGEEFSVVPYGLEALGTLRIEKGHVTGAEIDGRTSAHDLGLEKMLSPRKDFVGKPLAFRPALVSPERRQMVGLRSRDGNPIPSGSHLVAGEDARQPGRSQGHVTAMCFSPALEGYIALALLERGRQRYGETLFAADPLRGRHVPVDVVDACFVDKEGSRMHG